MKISRPLLLIHGYSASGTAFDQVRDALRARGITATNIDVCTYVSLNNEITIRDLAEGLDRAFRYHPVLKDDYQEFDAIVHSTGMLVLRSWLTNYNLPSNQNLRLKRLKHVVGLAPATWGSPQAQKGRSWLGAAVKGNRQFGPDFLNAGDRILDDLELGSRFTWELAHRDLLRDEPYYDRGTDTPYVSVFIGNQPYDGLDSIANDPGTDGTVRWAGCGLNTRKIKIDLTRLSPQLGERITMSPWADNRLDIPNIAVAGRNHGTILSDPDPEMMDLVTSFLQVGEEGHSYDDWMKAAMVYRAKNLGPMLVNPGFAAVELPEHLRTFFGHLLNSDQQELEGWQQFVVRARDERGDGVSDYMLEILKQGPNRQWEAFREMSVDVHAYGSDQSYRCFHVRLPKDLSRAAVPLRLRFRASTGTELMAYQGYGSEAQKLTATSEPVELDIPPMKDASLFFPFTTTLIEVVVNREPLPFDAGSRILTFLPPAS
jgi:pimeloyl-ACP methyl ester carboxylesterase